MGERLQVGPATTGTRIILPPVEGPIDYVIFHHADIFVIFKYFQTMQKLAPF